MRKFRFARACVAVLTSVCLTGSLIQAAPPAVAAERTPVRTELVDKRTATTRTFDNGDGTWTLESFLEPVNYVDEDTGTWLEIDSTLVTSEDTATPSMENRANSFQVKLPDILEGSWVSITDGSHAVKMRPAARLQEPAVSAPTLTPPPRARARRPDAIPASSKARTSPTR